jgi:hypothetical protein
MHRISEFVSSKHPLGPLDQVKLEEPEDSAAVLDTADPLIGAHKRHYTLLYGRKGSGKTSIIASYQCFMLLQKREKFPSFLHAQSDFQDYVVSVKAWDHLYDMMKSVLRGAVPVDLNGSADDLLEQTPVETLSDIWIDIIWEEIFKHFYTLYRNDKPKIRNSIKNIVSYFDEGAAILLPANPTEAADELFDSCKDDVRTFLKDQNRQFLILFDTMDKYPITNPTFLQLLGGLVRAISRFEIECGSVHVIFSLPEELVEYFKSRSSNLLKDFENSYAVRWKPIDLLRIVAYRYRLFLRLHDDQKLNLFEKLDLRERGDVHKFYQNWLPEVVMNEYGQEEESLAYIVRHTQLLPRHILALFDQIAIETQNITGGYKILTAAGIRLGVANREEWIGNEILHPFDFIYKDIRRNLKSSLQNLKPVFRYGEMMKFTPKLRKQYDWDQDQMMEMLYHMGVIGRIVSEDSPRGKAAARYVYADFYFNADGGMGFAHDADYCVHPLFSKLFGCSRNRGNDHRVIYPNRVNFELDQ